MTERSPTLTKASLVLRLSAVIELVAGTTLILLPGAVVRALIGVSATPADEVLARVLGGALLALGVTGMLARGPRAGRPAALGFATYDAVTVLVLASAAVAGDARGSWLWPVVVFHGILTIVLIAKWAGESFEVPDDVSGAGVARWESTEDVQARSPRSGLTCRKGSSP